MRYNEQYRNLINSIWSLVIPITHEISIAIILNIHNHVIKQNKRHNQYTLLVIRRIWCFFLECLVVWWWMINLYDNKDIPTNTIEDIIPWNPAQYCCFNCVQSIADELAMIEQLEFYQNKLKSCQPNHAKKWN